MGLDPICVFGGAFDPVHIGHLLIAEDVRAMKHLAKVLFMPCNIPPTKIKTEASSEDRLEMVRLAVRENRTFETSDIETKRKGVSYTIDTLRELRSRFGEERRLYLLMGMDQLCAIEGWRDPGGIADMCTILAAQRPGCEEAKIPDGLAGSVEILETRRVDISSTEIRRRLRFGGSIRYMVTEAVFDYIHLKGLYGAERRGAVHPQRHR